jgi:hypothetical protein
MNIIWGNLSYNPNIPWEIIKNNPDKNWTYTLLCQNPNLTWEIIQNNHQYQYQYQYQ